MEEISGSTLIAVVDDDAVTRRLLRGWLTAAECPTVECSSGYELLEQDPARLGAVCLDLGLGDFGGHEVLAHLRARDPELPVIVVTGDNEVSSAVRAMRQGAYDYLTKPLDRERLIHAVRRALSHRGLSTRVRALTAAGAKQAGGRLLVGDSPAMRALDDQITRVADKDVPVCIFGETGTGKELVARAIHERSGRKGGPFVAINCAAITESLLESELFGHERGAFTGAAGLHKGRFEQAQGGTLFLDELGEMSPAIQASLLRTLQERTVRRVGGTTEISVNVRVVSATHRDLKAQVAAGRFREDLYYRLVVFPIATPTLRQRAEDVPHLVLHFLRRFRDESGLAVERVSAEALDSMVRYPWPGNVRELQNVVHRAMLACDGPELRLAHLPHEIRALGLKAPPARKDAHPLHPSSGAAEAPATPPGEGGGAAVLQAGDAPAVASTAGPRESDVIPLRVLEEHAIAHALKATRGSVSRAAQLLGIGRATMYRRLAELGLGTAERGASELEPRP